MPWTDFLQQWTIAPSVAAIGTVAAILPVFFVVSLIDMASFWRFRDHPKFRRARYGFLIGVALQIVAVLFFEANLLAEMSSASQRRSDTITGLLVDLATIMALTVVTGYFRVVAGLRFKVQRESHRALIQKVNGRKLRR
jgi:peptidoglycan biosynthesis protein MviN/MurJ (putative lipid II flippase)